MPESQQPEDGIQLILDKILENPDVDVLDIGAGEGKWGKFLRGKVKSIDGAEIWKPYIDKFKLVEYYDNIINVNMMDFDYSKKKYDVMILGDVLEHLLYDDAVKFMAEAQKHIDTIYLSIPISLCIQSGSSTGNPYERHLYQWKDEQLQSLFDYELIHEGFNPNGLVKIGTYVWKK